MAGKSWQPSHEPPCSKRNRHPSHCRNSGKRERKGGGRRTAWAMSCHTMKRKWAPPVCTPRYTMLQSTSTWNSNTCAYVPTTLTSSGMLALFVVNSIYLHLTAWNACCCVICYYQQSLFHLPVFRHLVLHYTPPSEPQEKQEVSTYILCPEIIKGRSKVFGDKLIALCDVMLRYKLPLVWSRVTNSFMVFVFDN